MWGTEDLKRRIADVERIAGEARDVGNQALKEIAVHSGACVEIQKRTIRDLDELKGSNRWQLRGIVTILLTAIGAMAWQIVQHLPIFK